MKFWYVCASLIFFFTPTLVSAQQQQQAEQNPILVDASDLPSGLREQLVAKQKLRQYGEYAKWGHEVGIAVNESLEAVGSQAERIAGTNVGKFAMVLIAWKIMGNDLVQFVVGVPLLVVLIGVISWSYWRNCIPRRVLVYQEDKIKKYELKAGIENVDIRAGYAVIHFIFAVVVVLICCGILFF